ncbi:titin [Plutella xylostella]|uniref:titin n=1 Tax=Plutella xylostella TaxID=51655 RepID=UPI002032ED75|nr:titin [Plutella xylostella]
MRFYLVYRDDGTYDLVIDDREPIFEPIDPDDFGPASEPTEVYPLPDLNAPILAELRDTTEPESRSQTASPFLLSTKPYRPFSTEPIPEVPPLEEPIILNPNYHDEFGNLNDLLGDIDADALPKTKFKLPISEQYDPNYGKDEKGKKVKAAVKQVDEEMKDQTMTREEIDFMKQMKQDIDLATMEETAVSALSGFGKSDQSFSVAKQETVEEHSASMFTKKEIAEQKVKSCSFKEQITEQKSSTTEHKTVEQAASLIVDESITKAVSVAEEIKNEIAVELHTGDVKSSEIKKEDSKKVVESLKSTNEDNTKEKASKVSAKTIAITLERNAMHDDSIISSAKKEVEETIVSGTVKRLSSNFDKEQEAVKAVDERKDISKKVLVSDVKSKREVSKDTNSQNKSSTTSGQKSQKSEVKSDSKKEYSTSKLLAEQRAYTIGLQTIPNIRGSVHSSYHYDLLLKTFFIHLTDVMVALSRFILAEPVLKIEGSSQDLSKKTVSEEVMVDKEEKVRRDEKKVHKEMKEEKYSEEVQENVTVDIREEITHKRKSGSKMAQLTEKKPEDLIHDMDAVITEFQHKSGIEEEHIVEEEKRQEVLPQVSSQFEAEVVTKSEPLESKIESYESSKEVTEITKKNMEIIRSITEKSESKTSELKVSRDSRSRSKSREGRQMYVAVVESHVYTNKDTILDEQFSETSSEHSAEETVATEKQVYESTEQKSTVEEVIQEKSTVEEVIQEESKVEEVHKAIKELSIEKAVQELEEMAVCETKVESQKIEQLKVREPIIEPPVEVEKQIILSRKPCVIIPVNEDVEATVKIIQEISPPIVEEPPPETTIAEKTSTVESSQYESEDQTQTLTSRVQTTELEETTSSLVDESSIVMTNLEQTPQIQQTSHMTRSTKMEDLSQIQETTMTTQSTTETTELRKQLLRRLSLKSDMSGSMDSFPSTISTPTPMTVPPTPLTDEYMFRLECPMPKNLPSELDESSPSPEKEIDHEDLNIVKKKLVPHIDTKIERIVYDPPLPTPLEGMPLPEFTPQNGQLKEKLSEEEILEIERKSSLLASAIDETIKSIEEYKEQVIMEAKKQEVSSTLKEESSALKEEFSALKEESSVNVAQTEATPMTYTGFVKEAKLTIFDDFKAELAKENKEESIITNEVQLSTVTGTKQSDISSDVTEKMVQDSLKSTFAANMTTDSTQQDFKSTDHKAEIFSSSIQDESTALTDITKQSTEKVVENVSTGSSKECLFKVSKFTKAEETVTETKSSEVLPGYRPVPFNPEELMQQQQQKLQAASEQQLPGGFRPVQLNVQNGAMEPEIARPRSVTFEGETLGTTQGIISGMKENIMDEEVVKELGKPGLSDENIAVLISGESEMLREAHVMGVDFKKIKPVIDKLKDSEVLKALNDELTKTKEEKKQEERKWTTFLQKPKRVPPTAKFGYHGWLPQFIPEGEEYKVKIVKQPKPKVAPDYKPESFETGPLPWEERAANEPPPPPVEPEDPILIPEERPEFLEAVDPLPESEVPDLEETGIPLPPEKTEEPEPETTAEEPAEAPVDEAVDEPVELDIERVVEETAEIIQDMEQNKLAEQLLNSVQGMVDPAAPLEQQLSAMRAQLAALAQLPAVLQQSLDLVTRQLMQISHQETKETEVKTESTVEVVETVEKIEKVTEKTEIIEESSTKVTEQTQEQHEETTQQTRQTEQSAQQDVKSKLTSEEVEKLRREEDEMLEEMRRIEKQKKVAREFIKELMEQQQLDHESRQVKAHPTPRVGKPKPVFGPLTPQERPLVLPGGRKWRKPKDAFNEQLFAETLAAQVEIIQGTTKGCPFESEKLPFDPRINFMKYEKPPVSLEHLKESDVYKMVHNMDVGAGKRVDMLTPVVAECDYREKCRSMTPCHPKSTCMDQQLQP